MRAPVAEKISKWFTTYVDPRLRGFEPNFPRSATLNIEKHARCGRTAGRRPGALLYSRFTCADGGYGSNFLAELSVS